MLLRLYVLLRSYLSPGDILRWWLANMISTKARRFTKLYTAVLPLTLQGEWQGCDLMVAAPAPPHGTSWTHPACQCGTRPQLMPGAQFLTREGGDIRDPSTVLLKGNHVRAAPWVKHTLYTQPALAESVLMSSPAAQLPRWQLHPPTRGFPSQSGNPKSCRVPHLIVTALQKVEAGLRSLRSVARALQEELDTYTFGNVGMTPQMQQLQKVVISNSNPKSGSLSSACLIQQLPGMITLTCMLLSLVGVPDFLLSAHCYSVWPCPAGI
eukprot:12431438-Karenia_brevis.AAC.1